MKVAKQIKLDAEAPTTRVNYIFAVACLISLRFELEPYLPLLLRPSVQQTFNSSSPYEYAYPVIVSIDIRWHSVRSALKRRNAGLQYPVVGVHNMHTSECMS